MKQGDEKNSIMASVGCFINKSLIIGFDDGIICKYSIHVQLFLSQAAEEKPETIFIGHSGRINQLFVDGDNKLYSCSNDCSIRIWSIAVLLLIIIDFNM